MDKIVVITDTDSSLPPEVAARYGIHLVPITINFDAESYTTGVDIDDRLLFEKIDRLNKLPTTSAPSPNAFAAEYEAAFKEGAQAVICICVSSLVSSTYNAALTAREMFPERDITVIDSLSLCMGQGFLALLAAEAAQKGAARDQILALLEDAGQRMHLYAVLPTLKYLAMSGRVGKFVAGMAATLNIKPILTIQDGKLVLLERVRTRKKAIERMLELANSCVNGKPVERAAIIHVNDLEGAHELEGMLRARMPFPPSILTAAFTPGLSVHAGTGVVGVVILTGK
jgi:DegV family protein with EDD domain